MARKKPFLLLPFNLVSKPIAPTCNLPLKQIRYPAGIHTFLKFQTISNIFKKSLYIQGPRAKFDTFENKYKKCHNSFKKWLIYEFKKVIILYGCVL